METMFGTKRRQKPPLRSAGAFPTRMR